MNPVPLWRSLRLRLPLLISGLIVIVLAAFLWTVNRLVEQTLLRAGAVRAQAAADQVAALMATAASRGVNEVRRLAASDDLRRYVQSASPDKEAQEAAIRHLLLPLAAANQPPVVLTNRGGDRLIEVASPTSGRASPSVATAAPVPGASGLGEFRNADGIVFYDVVADVTDRPGAEGAQAAALGSLVVRRILSAAQTTDTINRLVGGGAIVGIGNQRGDVWSTFSRPLPAPPIDAAHSGVSEYTRADGDRRIGAASVIGGTPWTVWVELSRQTVLQPARTVLTRMLLLALAFVVIAAVVVAIVTRRITKPLHELTVVSSSIAAGEFSRRVKQTARQDEIGRLGSAFNTMTAYVDRDHQELERRVAERTQSLQAAMDELEAFSYSVSHDLRAPLRHIAGFAALLEQSAAPLDEEGRHYVETIAGAATRMGQLIDDLLAFSRVGRAAMAVRRVDLGELVRDVQSDVGAGRTNVVWRVGELPVVAGDPALLRLVLVNLVSNAVKYSSKRDRPEIEIGTRAEPDEQRPVIFIRDNGVGFDMTYAHKLFGVFSRLHSVDDFEGTGIGLANVRRIVTRHGGRVWADAEVDRGATFYVSLPALGNGDEATAA
jgi:signal transduction histidine kinase